MTEFKVGDRVRVTDEELAKYPDLVNGATVLGFRIFDPSNYSKSSQTFRSINPNKLYVTIKWDDFGVGTYWSPERLVKVES